MHLYKKSHNFFGGAGEMCVQIKIEGFLGKAPP